MIRRGGGGAATPVPAGFSAGPTAVEQVFIATGVNAGLWAQLTSDDILPGFGIAAFSLAGVGYAALVTRGDNLTVMTAAAAYTSGPATAAAIANTLGGSVGGGDVAPGAWTIVAPFVAGAMAGNVLRQGADLGTDPTWTATLTAQKLAIVKTATVTVTWTSNVGFAVGAAGLNTQAALEGLAGVTIILSAARARTTTVSPAAQKVYYWFPKGRGLSTATLFGFPAAFNAPVDVAFTNINGIIETYSVYESTNLLIGVALPFVWS